MTVASTSISPDQMKLVLDVSRLLTVTADLGALLVRIAEAATSLLGAERASIFLHDARTNELWTTVALGAKEIRVPCTAGIVGHVFQANALLSVPRPYEDARFNREVDRKTGFVTRNLLTTPLRDIDGKPLGVIQVVNHIGGDFTAAEEALVELLADQAGVAIQRHRFQQEVIRSAGLRHEMGLAQRVQQAMIPTTTPDVPNVHIVGWSRPASVTGGDCFDYWKLQDGRLGIFLADASGHGIAPAIVVSQARTLVRALSELDCDPSRLLSRVNARLAEDLEAGRFVTAFMGCLSPSGELKWTSAGHGPMFVRPAAGEPLVVLEPTVPPIGIMPDLGCDAAGTVRIAPGGMLFVMSDGVFEARSERGQLFETSRVVEVLERCIDESPEDALARLKQAVLEWQGKDDPVDDQSVVIVQVGT
jgi:phosphoserine phosphatase